MDASSAGSLSERVDSFMVSPPGVARALGSGIFPINVGIRGAGQKRSRSSPPGGSCLLPEWPNRDSSHIEGLIGEIRIRHCLLKLGHPDDPAQASRPTGCSPRCSGPHQESPLSDLRLSSRRRWLDPRAHK